MYTLKSPVLYFIVKNVVGLVNNPTDSLRATSEYILNKMPIIVIKREVNYFILAHTVVTTIISNCSQNYPSIGIYFIYCIYSA